MDTIQHTVKENPFYPLLQLSRKNKKTKKIKKNSKINTKKSISLIANSKSKNQMKKKAKQNIKKKLKNIIKQEKMKLELDLETVIKNISKL